MKDIFFDNNANIEELESLLNNGYDINTYNEDYITPLFTANAEKTKLFLKYGADPFKNKFNKEDDVFFYTIKDESLPVEDLKKKINTLIEYGVDINKLYREQKNILFFCRNDIALFLLEKNPDLIKQITFNGENILFRKDLSIELFKYYVENGVNVNHIKKWDDTVLNANNNSLEKLEILLQHGADPNYVTNKHPLYICDNNIKDENYFYKLIKLFEKFKFNFKNLNPNMETPLFVARNAKEVHLLLKLGVDMNQVNAKMHGSESAIIYNSLCSRYGSALALMKKGADLELCNKEHGTLIINIFNSKLVNEFINRGGNVNYVNQFNENALHNMNTNKDEVKKLMLLLENGIDVYNKSSRTGLSAIDALPSNLKEIALKYTITKEREIIESSIMYEKENKNNVNVNKRRL